MRNMRKQTKKIRRKANIRALPPIETLATLTVNGPDDIGRAIKVGRNHLGLLQAEAAGLCNVSPKFLSELEQGKKSAHLGKTLNVLRSLGLKLNILPSSILLKAKKKVKA